MEHFYETIGEDWFDYKPFYETMVKYLKDDSVIVEVGCWKGRSLAFLMVEIINSGKRMTVNAVDHFLGSEEHLDPKSPGFCEGLSKDPNFIFNEFMQNMSAFKGKGVRLNINRNPSVVAASMFADESVDFVFIDGAHDEISVFNDISAWYSKVKPGMVIAGHDYQHHHWGVITGVNRYFDRKDFKIASNGVWIHEKPSK